MPEVQRVSSSSDDCHCNTTTSPAVTLRNRPVRSPASAAPPCPWYTKCRPCTHTRQARARTPAPRLKARTGGTSRRPAKRGPTASERMRRCLQTRSSSAGRCSRALPAHCVNAKLKASRAVQAQQHCAICTAHSHHAASSGISVCSSAAVSRTMGSAHAVMHRRRARRNGARFKSPSRSDVQFNN